MCAWLIVLPLRSLPGAGRALSQSTRLCWPRCGNGAWRRETACAPAWGGFLVWVWETSEDSREGGGREKGASLPPRGEGQRGAMPPVAPSNSRYPTSSAWSGYWLSLCSIRPGRIAANLPELQCINTISFIHGMVCRPKMGAHIAPALARGKKQSSISGPDLKAEVERDGATLWTE